MSRRVYHIFTGSVETVALLFGASQSILSWDLDTPADVPFTAQMPNPELPTSSQALS